MDAPEELRQAIAAAVGRAADAWERLDPPMYEDFGPMLADAVLSVPVVRDAFYVANEAEVYLAALELACSDGWSDGESAMQSYIESARDHIAATVALRPEAVS